MVIGEKSKRSVEYIWLTRTSVFIQICIAKESISLQLVTKNAGWRCESEHTCRVQISGNTSGGSTGGGGLGGLNPPPPLGLPSKNLMCIEKRHHNMSRPTQYVPSSYSTLSQAQPQTIGFNPPPPPWAAKWTCDVIMDCFLWSPLRW